MNTQPRILFVLHLPPPVHGVSMMGQYIRESLAVNGEFDCRFVNLTTARSLEDIGKGGARKLLSYFGLLKHIRHEVRNFRPDLVYVTPNTKGVPFYKDFLIVQMLKRMGCHVLMHFHNKGVTLRQGRWLDNLLYRQYFCRTNVMLLAEELYQDIQKYVDRDCVMICPNGIPDNRNENGNGKSQSACVACRSKNEDENVRILFLSNLLIDKGILTLLDALEQLKTQGRDFTCDVVGGETAEMDGQQLDEHIAQRGLQGIVNYLGSKYGAEKETVWAAADVFVMPSFDECFPLVLLEAMQHALPCIATRVGGIPSIVEEGKTGLLVPERNVSALADAIGTLLDSETLRKEMGQQGHEKYLQQFTLQCFERQFVHCLKKGLERG